MVGVAGGTASGKTMISDQIYKHIGGLSQATLLPLDYFYKSLSDEEIKNIHNKNFDHPDALDWSEIKACIKSLINGDEVTVPIYNFVTRKRDLPGIKIKSTKLLIVEGIFALYDEEI